MAQYFAQKREGKWDIEAAVSYGCKAAARVIEVLGCLDPIVWADEVDTPRYPREQVLEDPAPGLNESQNLKE